MSDTASESVRKEIDHLLDKVEDEVSKIKPMLLREAASFAVGTLRKIFAIPDTGEFADTPADGGGAAAG